MPHSLNKIQDETKELIARIAAAVPGNLGHTQTYFSDKAGLERIIYVATAVTFCVYAHKILQPFNSSGYENELRVSFLSQSIRKENARYGLTTTNSSFAALSAVEYIVVEKPNASLKSRLAMEMDRSGIRELEDLAAQFVAELKEAETPIPAFSSRVFGYSQNLQLGPVG